MLLKTTRLKIHSPYFCQVKFDVNLHSISLLDDMLLILCLPGFFMFGLLQFSSATMSMDLSHPSRALTMIKIIFYILQVSWLGSLYIAHLPSMPLLHHLQVMIQTPMIIDGLRRCSNTQGSQGDHETIRHQCCSNNYSV